MSSVASRVWMIDRQVQLGRELRLCAQTRRAGRHGAQSRSGSRAPSHRARRRRIAWPPRASPSAASTGLPCVGTCAMRMNRRRERHAATPRGTTSARATSSGSSADRMQIALGDARRLRARGHLGEVRREHVVRQMTVGVDHADSAYPRAAGWRRVEATSMGLPPSGLAASTMPFDSIPMSLAGFRFATIATCRPTSASASYASADPRDEGPLLRPEIDLELHELLRVRHALGGGHLRHAQVDLHEVVD